MAYIKLPNRRAVPPLRSEVLWGHEAFAAIADVRVFRAGTPMRFKNGRRSGPSAVKLGSDRFGNLALKPNGTSDAIFLGDGTSSQDEVIAAGTQTAVIAAGSAFAAWDTGQPNRYYGWGSVRSIDASSPTVGRVRLGFGTGVAASAFREYTWPAPRRAVALVKGQDAVSNPPTAIVDGSAVTPTDTGAGTATATIDWSRYLTFYAVGREATGFVSTQCALVIIAGGEVPAAALRDLTDFPWQIFRPHRARIYSFPSAGATLKTITDAGVATDAIAQLAVTLGITDTGSGTETLPGAAAALGVTDAGSATDLLAAIGAALALSDSGSAVDAIVALSAALAVSDSGAAADAVAILTETLLQITDSGTASDALAGIVAQLGVADSATGLDVIASVSTSLLLADAGAGADAMPSIAALAALADSASGADSIAVLAETLLQIADAGSGVDGVSIAVDVTLADAATGVDTLLAITALLALADSGVGIDVAARFDAAVRIVRLVFSFRRRRAAFRFARRTMHFQLAA